MKLQTVGPFEVLDQRVTYRLYCNGNTDEFKEIFYRALTRVLGFSKRHALGIFNPIEFIEDVYLFSQKSEFDENLISKGWPIEKLIPLTYVGLGQAKSIFLVSLPAYQKIFPENSEKDYENIIVHELAHLLHVAFLKGNEALMGPPYIYEGFACFVAEQYLEEPLPSMDEVRSLCEDSSLSYPRMAAIFRKITEKIFAHFQ